MDFLHLFLLSVVQGLTEFLPVSSSGHLVLFPYFFGTEDQGILIDVALHIGTLLAILVYYRRDILAMVVAVLGRWTPETRTMRNLAFAIVIGSIPAVAIGLLLRVFFPEGLRGVLLITINMITFAVFMGYADRMMKQVHDITAVTWKKSLLIGCAQALALMPGVSRSGATITAARFFGLTRVEAARFSFLLGIPAMAGAGLLSVLEIWQTGNAALAKDAVVAVFLAFFAGLAAIHFMMRWLKRAGLMPFVVYRLLLGAILIAVYIR